MPPPPDLSPPPSNVIAPPHTNYISLLSTNAASRLSHVPHVPTPLCRHPNGPRPPPRRSRPHPQGRRCRPHNRRHRLRCTRTWPRAAQITASASPRRARPPPLPTTSKRAPGACAVALSVAWRGPALASRAKGLIPRSGEMATMGRVCAMLAVSASRVRLLFPFQAIREPRGVARCPR